MNEFDSYPTFTLDPRIEEGVVSAYTFRKLYNAGYINEYSIRPFQNENGQWCVEFATTDADYATPVWSRR